MTYSLEFDSRALKEWKKLGDTVRQQFKKKLAEVLLNPRVVFVVAVDRRERDQVYRKAAERLE
jgi:mRNA interferase RelE/StbE